MQWISADYWKQLSEEGTNAHRIASHHHGWIDRYGDWILESSSKFSLHENLIPELASRFNFSPRGWLFRQWTRDAHDQKPARIVFGSPPGEFVVRESGVSFYVSPAEGYSSGLFLDQRLNRRWIQSLNPRKTLNLFAYTCSFSVCAALAGSNTLSVDTSKHALQRGKANLQLNHIDIEKGHRFIADDVLRFVPRLLRRAETFDLIILDPPTFGRSDGRVFQLERELPNLVDACAQLLSPQGSLLVSCNNARWSLDHLLALCASSLPARRKFDIARGATPPEISHPAITCRISALD